MNFPHRPPTGLLRVVVLLSLLVQTILFTLIITATTSNKSIRILRPLPTTHIFRSRTATVSPHPTHTTTPPSTNNPPISKPPSVPATSLPATASQPSNKLTASHKPPNSHKLPPSRKLPTLPPPLRDLHPLSSNDPRLPHLAAHPFTSPSVLTSYIRPSLHPAAAYDLFLFTSALFRRNLTATHCVLSNHTLLPVVSHIDDVVYCRVNRLPPEGTTLSVALRRDHSLSTSLAGPVLIAHGYDTTLRHGDIISSSPNKPPTLRSFATFARARVDPVKPPSLDAPTRPPRYRLCVATMSRIATYMLPDWVDHHRRLGADHIFIFDNGASPPIAHGPLGQRPDVEVLVWPWAKSQLSAFSFALLAARGRCERLMKMDSDEFVLLGLGKSTEAWRNGRRPLMEYVRRKEQASGLQHVALRDLTMVNSGHLRRPHGHVAEMYVHANNSMSHRHGKSVCGTDEDWRAGVIHVCGHLGDGKIPFLVEPSPDLKNGNLWPQRPDADALLIHFYWRSWEEMVEKFTTGRASFRIGTIARADDSRWSVDRPDREYLKIDGRPGVMRYTFFRDFWRRVRAEARDRVKECVVTSVVDGRRTNRVVNLDVQV